MVLGFPCRTQSSHDDFKMTLCTCVLGIESWSIFLNYGYPVTLWFFLVEDLSRKRSFSVFSLFVLNLSQCCFLLARLLQYPLFFSVTSYLRRKPVMFIPSFTYLIVSSPCFPFVPLQGVFLQQPYLCRFHLILILLMGFIWLFLSLSVFITWFFKFLLLDLLMISGFPCRTESFHDNFKMTLCKPVLGSESWSLFLNYGHPVIFWWFVEHLSHNR